MQVRPIRCRRVRRTDNEAVFALLDAAGVSRPAADRAGRHRFRRLVADLGGDCYVALADETVVGVVHVTYARHLIDGQRATVELLAVDRAHPADEVVGALARLVAARAERRGCRIVDWRDPADSVATRALAAHLGARPIGQHLRVEIPRMVE
jgi:hypothetical protein